MQRAVLSSNRYRALRYSLRAMFLVLTLCSVWLGVQVNWIRKRHEFLDSPYAARWHQEESLSAPGMLWILGEEGTGKIVVFRLHDDAGQPLLEQARRLFPEAEILDLAMDP